MVISRQWKQEKYDKSEMEVRWWNDKEEDSDNIVSFGWGLTSLQHISLGHIMTVKPMKLWEIRKGSRDGKTGEAVAFRLVSRPQPVWYEWPCKEHESFSQR